MDALVNSLTEPQQLLLRETTSDALADLDEDALLDLHLRIRRARDKYVGVYRRTASGRVSERGGRGHARPTNRRNYDRAEAFETALARVSRRLAVVARQNAAAIKADRIAAVRNQRQVNPPGSGRADNAPTMETQVIDRAPDSGALRRQRAANIKAGARRQAKKDNR
jgi:hypothetical protein